MLDGKILSPVKGFLDTYDILSTALPVFIIQANFVQGGLLLCFSCEHSSLDMNGQGQLIRLFAKACRNEAFTKEELQEGNRESAHIFPFFKDGEQLQDHSNILRPSQLQPGPPRPALPAPLKWDYWRIAHSKLAELKREASEGLTDDWISTNDALLAFAWQRLIATRLSNGLVPPNENTTIQRAVNGRSSVKPPISDAFMGHSVAAVDTTWAAQDLVAAPLASIALALRKSRQEVNDLYMRSFATLLRDEPDRTKISYGAKLHPMNDLISSSWADLKLANCQFGLLGQADFFRRPLLMEVPSLIYFMPRTRDGDIDIATSIFEGDIEGLKADSAFTKYAEYIG